MISPSVMAQSKSGKFLMGRMYDEQWRNVDLNGDGQYYDRMTGIISSCWIQQTSGDI